MLLRYNAQSIFSMLYTVVLSSAYSIERCFVATFSCIHCVLGSSPSLATVLAGRHSDHTSVQVSYCFTKFKVGPPTAQFMPDRRCIRCASFCFHGGHCYTVSCRIVKARQEGVISTTTQLVSLIGGSRKSKPGGSKQIHPATRVFQVSDQPLSHLWYNHPKTLGWP